MCVDVRDVVGRGVGGGECHLHGALCAVALGIVGGDVVRVGRDGAADDVGVDRGASGAGVFFRLQDQHRGTLAHHEAVAVDAAGARGGGGVVVAPRQRLHRRERRDRDRVDRRLGTAGDHDIGQARADVLGRVHDRLGARRARAGDRAGEGASAEVQGQVTCGGVGHEHGNGHGHHPTGALFTQRVPRVEQGPHAADAGGEIDAEALGLDLGRAGVRPGLHRRHHRELRCRVQPPRHGTLQHRLRSHGGLRGERDGQLVLLHPVVLERACAGRAGQQCGPALGGGAADRRRRADSGDDDA